MKQLSVPWLTGGAVCALALLLYGDFLNLRNASRSHDDYIWVVHTREVLGKLDALLLRTTEAEASQRAFVITGERQYLEPITASIQGANADLDDLTRLTIDNSVQQERIPVIRQHLEARFQELQAVIDTRTTSGTAAASQRIVAGHGQAEMDAIGTLVGQMDLSERALLAERTSRSEETYREARFASLVCGVASLVAIGGLLMMLSVYSYSRDRAAALVLEQAERLRTTLSSIGDAVIVTDVAGRVTNLNAVAESLTGWTTAQAAGIPLDEVFHIVNEASREVVESPAAKAIREGTIVGLANHTILIAKDGREHPIDDSAAPVKDMGGNVSGVVLVFRDVAERRAVERSQAVLASIVDDSDDAIVGKTLDGVIVSWNAGAERLFGYARSEAVGQPIFLIVPPELRDEEKSILDRLRHGERIAHFETKRVAKDGRRIAISLTVSPLRDSSGQIIGASKVARDITAKAKSEADIRFLAEASASLAEILDYKVALQTVAKLAVPFFADWCAIDMLTPDGNLERIAVAHIDPNKVEFAHELQRRFPATRNDSQGTWRIIGTGRSELVPEITNEMLEASVKDEEILRIIRELGLNSYMGAPIEVHGKILGAITFIAAESGRRYDARDLAIAEDLAHRAAVAVENTRLYGELREADVRKDRFLATLAHELRNPLAPMLYSIELAEAADLDPRVLPQAHDTIRRQLAQLVRLVDDLLDVSRITRDKLDLRPARIELASIVRQAVETVKPLAETKGVVLDVALPNRHIYLNADPTRIAQVFTNLLNNACKFTKEGGHVWVSAEASNDKVSVVVRDDGIGIPPVMLPRIFEMFAQLDDSLEGSRGGLGIGLTLVRRLVEMHGGSVEAMSRGLGAGSEFVVHLPISVESEIAATRMSAAVSPATPTTAHGEPRRVLIVDDNMDAAVALSMLLGTAGHTTELAHDGAAAVKYMEEFRPDLVLLDIGLPIMSGYEAARAIREQPWGKDVMLVAVTGWGQDQDRQKSKAAGFDYHLVKPIGQADIAKLLNEVKREPIG